MLLAKNSPTKNFSAHPKKIRGEEFSGKEFSGNPLERLAKNFLFLPTVHSWYSRKQKN
jgi:hypothetical protein